MPSLLKPNIAPDPRSRCRSCGATSYRPVIARDVSGRLTATALYQCAGCSRTFRDLTAWRGDGTRLPARDSPGDDAPRSVSF